MAENSENQNTEIEKQEQEKEIIRVNAYYLIHNDELNEIAQTLILLKDYNNTWKIVNKRDKYYVFYNNNRAYLKIWKDKKNNLLFYVGENNDNLFYDNIQVFEYNLGCILYTNNAVYGCDKGIEFRNLDIIDIVRQIDYRLVDPVIWLLCKVLY